MKLSFLRSKNGVQGASSIAMNVFLLLTVVWFCDVMYVEVFDATSLVHESAVSVKVCCDLPIIADLLQDRFFTVIL